jgi:hypothetical protein
MRGIGVLRGLDEASILTQLRGNLPAFWNYAFLISHAASFAIKVLYRERFYYTMVAMYAR